MYRFRVQVNSVLILRLLRFIPKLRSSFSPIHMSSDFSLMFSDSFPFTPIIPSKPVTPISPSSRHSHLITRSCLSALFRLFDRTRFHCSDVPELQTHIPTLVISFLSSPFSLLLRLCSVFSSSPCICLHIYRHVLSTIYHIRIIVFNPLLLQSPLSDFCPNSIFRISATLSSKIKPACHVPISSPSLFRSHSPLSPFLSKTPFLSETPFTFLPYSYVSRFLPYVFRLFPPYSDISD